MALSTVMWGLMVSVEVKKAKTKSKDLDLFFSLCSDLGEVPVHTNGRMDAPVGHT